MAGLWDYRQGKGLRQNLWVGWGRNSSIHDTGEPQPIFP